jgi:hypothetical protein
VFPTTDFFVTCSLLLLTCTGAGALVMRLCYYHHVPVHCVVCSLQHGSGAAGYGSTGTAGEVGRCGLIVSKSVLKASMTAKTSIIKCFRRLLSICVTLQRGSSSRPSVNQPCDIQFISKIRGYISSTNITACIYDRLGTTAPVCYYSRRLEGERRLDMTKMLCSNM